MRSLPKTLLILRQSVPGKSSLRAITEGKKEDVKSHGIMMSEIVYKNTQASKTKRIMDLAIRGVKLSADSAVSAAILTYKIWPTELGRYQIISAMRTDIE